MGPQKKRSCFQCLWALVDHPDDTELDTTRKHLLIVGNIAQCIACLIVVLRGDQSLREAGLSLGFMCSFVSACALLLRRKATDMHITLFLACSWIGAAAADWNSVAGLDTTREYPMFILVIDLLLVFRINDRVTFVFLLMSCLWLFTTFLEDVIRFGMYDIAGLPSYESREEVNCQLGGAKCDKLPCTAGVATAFANLMGQYVVFLLDFYFTRGFAWQVTEEKARLENSVQVASRIAQALSEFDLVSAEKDLAHVKEDGNLPEQFVVVLENILGNLKVYRPYLPHSCLPSYIKDVSDSEDIDETTKLDSEVVPQSITSGADQPLRKYGSSSSQVSANSQKISRTGSGSGSTRRVKRLDDSMAVATGQLSNGRVAVMALNVINSASRLKENPNEYLQQFESFLTMVIQAVQQNKGVTEIFLGDHVLTSFNASRSCHAYGSAASRAAVRITTAMPERFASCAISSARATCGVVGCPEMKRYTIFSNCVLLALALERYARRWNLPMICDSSVQKDTWTFFEHRLIPVAATIIKKDIVLPVKLWELVAVLTTEKNDEWMYELEGNALSKYSWYEAIAVMYLDGKYNDALHKANEVPDAHQFPAMSTLVERIAAGVPPEVINLEL
ncbi:hypothetical protein DIPPA_10798 [Diplonema papillatum]|nr:hypothetical protein DIPPA_10798 [Diplonema papillatum]